MNHDNKTLSFLTRIFLVAENKIQNCFFQNIKIRQAGNDDCFCSKAAQSYLKFLPQFFLFLLWLCSKKRYYFLGVAFATATVLFFTFLFFFHTRNFCFWCFFFVNKKKTSRSRPISQKYKLVKKGGPILVALLLKRNLQKRNKKKKGTKCKKKLNHRNKPTRNYQIKEICCTSFQQSKKKKKKIVLSEKKSCALLESYCRPTLFLLTKKKSFFPQVSNQTFYRKK